MQTIETVLIKMAQNMHDHLLEQQVVTSQSPGADSTYSSQFLKPIWIKVTSSENIQ